VVLLLAWPVVGVLKHVDSAGAKRTVPAPLQKITVPSASPGTVRSAWPGQTEPAAASKCSPPVSPKTAVGGDGLGAPRGDHKHQGYDLITDLTEPVHSVLDGVIIQSGYNPGKAGTLTKVKHQGVVTWYHHMILGSELVVGTHVKKGQFIGLTGREGDASGPHVHFEVHISSNRKVGKTQDPVAWLKLCGVTYKRIPHQGT
jgi:murein DD-endopeptidase MepM/ murein hydrolase activator NlpD